MQLRFGWLLGFTKSVVQIMKITDLDVGKQGSIFVKSGGSRYWKFDYGKQTFVFVELQKGEFHKLSTVVFEVWKRSVLKSRKDLRLRMKEYFSANAQGGLPKAVWPGHVLKQHGCVASHVPAETMVLWKGRSLAILRTWFGPFSTIVKYSFVF